MQNRRKAQLARKEAQERFQKSRRVENQFRRELLSVSRQVNAIVRGFAPKGDVQDITDLVHALNRYADILTPWARSVASRMIAQVSRKDEQAWAQHGREIGRALRAEIINAPTGEAMLQELANCVDLITSLPREAAQRVHRLTVQGMIEGGRRASEISQEILATGHVTESRARLIARTEVARTASTLTESRAKFVGSEGYIWRSSGDADVRPAVGTKNFAALNTLAKGSHRKLNGTFHKWNEPPIASQNGERAHPGQIYNCRCYPEPVLPD